MFPGHLPGFPLQDPLQGHMRWVQVLQVPCWGRQSLQSSSGSPHDFHQAGLCYAQVASAHFTKELCCDHTFATWDKSSRAAATPEIPSYGMLQNAVGHT